MKATMRADVLETNTFQASSFKLAEYGLEARHDDVNRGAVAAARRAECDSSSTIGLD